LQVAKERSPTIKFRGYAVGCRSKIYAERLALAEAMDLTFETEIIGTSNHPQMRVPKMAPRRGWKKNGKPCEFDIAAISMPGEEWRPVVGWERFYKVSTLGRCLSLHQMGRLITGLKLRGGYRALKLRDGDRKAYGILHCMVLEAFVGPRPTGQYACHENGDSTDNRLANLRWDTNAGNQADRKRHGTARYRGPHALTEHDVRTIRTSPQISDDEWASRFGVSWISIKDARLGRTWAQVETPPLQRKRA